MLPQQSRSLSINWKEVSELANASRSGTLTPEQQAVLEAMPDHEQNAFHAMLQQQQM